MLPGTTNYTLHGKNIIHMTQGANTLHFFYDASNKPAIVDFNGTKYAYVHNLQGDIVAILDSNKNVVVSYVYDAWGRPISCSGTMANTLGKINPFRYRGYVYDEETRLYYNRTRYYNPLHCLFVSSDSAKVLTISNTPLVSVNLYLYCGNNPTGRRDEDGDFWLQALVGVAVQYASDVLTNVLNGETGADIFKPTSSLGTYIAAGVTAVIPGMNGFGDLLSNVVKEGICIIEKAVTGQDINWSESVNNVMMETANDLVLGVVFDPLADYVSTKVSSLPPNYSTYAGKQYKRNPNLTMPQIKNRLQRDCKIHRRVIVPASEFAVGFARSSVGDVLEAVF